ncbi:hypothetical protein BC940DRAFT_368118 [Gongronella butleri]|nr:hypothetical protein BC940DRAFT_368118 [Gongronella butleri]
MNFKQYLSRPNRGLPGSFDADQTVEANDGQNQQNQQSFRTSYVDDNVQSNRDSDGNGHGSEPMRSATNVARGDDTQLSDILGQDIYSRAKGQFPVSINSSTASLKSEEMNVNDDLKKQHLQQQEQLLSSNEVSGSHVDHSPASATPLANADDAVVCAGCEDGHAFDATGVGNPRRMSYQQIKPNPVGYQTPTICDKLPRRQSLEQQQQRDKDADQGVSSSMPGTFEENASGTESPLSRADDTSLPPAIKRQQDALHRTGSGQWRQGAPEITRQSPMDTSAANDTSQNNAKTYAAAAAAGGATIGTAATIARVLGFGGSSADQKPLEGQLNAQTGGEASPLALDEEQDSDMVNADDEGDFDSYYGPEEVQTRELTPQQQQEYNAKVDSDANWGQQRPDGQQDMASTEMKPFDQSNLDQEPQFMQLTSDAQQSGSPSASGLSGKALAAGAASGMAIGAGAAALGSHVPEQDYSTHRDLPDTARGMDDTDLAARDVGGLGQPGGMPISNKLNTSLGPNAALANTDASGALKDASRAFDHGDDDDIALDIEEGNFKPKRRFSIKDTFNKAFGKNEAKHNDMAGLEGGDWDASQGDMDRDMGADSTGKSSKWGFKKKSAAAAAGAGLAGAGVAAGLEANRSSNVDADLDPDLNAAQQAQSSGLNADANLRADDRPVLGRGFDNNMDASMPSANVNMDPSAKANLAKYDATMPSDLIDKENLDMHRPDMPSMNDNADTNANAGKSSSSGIKGKLAGATAAFGAIGAAGAGAAAGLSGKLSGKGDANAPNVDVNAPNAEMNAPDVSGNINAPDLSGKLNANAPDLSGNLPSADVNANAPDLNASGNMPSMNKDAPDVSGKLPSADLDANAPNMDMPSGKLDLDKNVDASLPSADLDKDVNANADLDKPSGGIKGKLAGATAAIGAGLSGAFSGKDKSPNVDANAPDLSGKLPSADINANTSDFSGNINAPDLSNKMNVNAPDLSGNMDANAPNMSGNMPSTDMDASMPAANLDKDTNADLDMDKPSEGIKGKLAGATAAIGAAGAGMAAGMSGKLSGKGDVNAPNVDANAPGLSGNAPDLSGNMDVNAPDMSVKHPSASVDADMPSANLDKNMNVNAPNESGNLPSTDIDANKNLDMDASMPSANLDKDVNADVDMDKPSGGINGKLAGATAAVGAAGAGLAAGMSGKFSGKGDAPNVDANAPKMQVSAPNVDANAPSLSGKGPSMDVNAPNVSGSLPSGNLDAQGKLPSADLNADGSLNAHASGSGLGAKLKSLSKRLSFKGKKSADHDATLDASGANLDRDASRGKANLAPVQNPNFNAQGTVPSVDAQHDASRAGGSMGDAAATGAAAGTAGGAAVAGHSNTFEPGYGNDQASTPGVEANVGNRRRSGSVVSIEQRRRSSLKDYSAAMPVMKTYVPYAQGVAVERNAEARLSQHNQDVAHRDRRYSLKGHELQQTGNTVQERPQNWLQRLDDELERLFCRS